MPPTLGAYELRYVLHDRRRVLVSSPIAVTPVAVELSAPETATVGETLMIPWEGPDYQNDYISIAEIGSMDDDYINYNYTRVGSILNLQMPAKTGVYEIRYVMHQDNTVLARQTITLEEVGASIIAPASVNAGQEIEIEWTGPNYKNDYISLAEIGSADNQYLESTYTRKGSQLQLQIPGAPGTYEIRYVQKQGTVVLARQTITVNAALASLAAPISGAAGTTVSVEWDGPAYSGDYISIAIIGSKDKDRETFRYVRYGNPLLIELPKEIGEYELRYVMKQDATVLARIPIQVTE